MVVDYRAVERHGNLQMLDLRSSIKELPVLVCFDLVNLTNLAPDIQQAILDLEPTTDPVPRFREREVRTIAILPNWEKQRLLWRRLVKLIGKRESNLADHAAKN
jgi:hypothetical protein